MLDGGKCVRKGGREKAADGGEKESFIRGEEVCLES